MLGSPLVCCIMLTRDRREMTRRAVRAFEAQTYRNKQLLIWDTSTENCYGDYGMAANILHVTRAPSDCGCQNLSIGKLRNDAIGFAVRHPDTRERPDVFITWDSDDWSHPKRIEEQVSLLVTTDSDAVGYSDLLFYRDPEAWHYRAPTYPIGYTPGTALAFRRKFWEDRPYRDVSDREERHFIEGRKVPTVASTGPDGPRMVATIHGGNTMAANYADLLSRPSSFERAPQWDEYCREALSLSAIANG